MLLEEQARLDAGIVFVATMIRTGNDMRWI